MSRPGTHQSQGIVAGDWALSAGFGASASVSAVAAGSSDLSGKITITANGAGLAARPTATLTFKNGAWPIAPFAVCARGSSGSQLSVQFTVSTTTTTLVLTFEGTPVAAQTFEVFWAVFGGTTV